MDDKTKIKELAEENAKLKEELQVTKEHLKKYTAPSYKKEYYEKNKIVSI
jgi:cell shape-determining protein MreC